MTTERPRASGTPAAPAQHVIRPATVADAPGIAEAHVVSWQAAYRDLLPQSLLDGLSVERRTAHWRQSIPTGDRDVHVAVGPDGRIGGFVATGPSRDDDADATVGELMTLYLRQQLWRRGIGGRLHAAGIADLTRRFEQATLWVLDSNARSRAFYERQGWRPDGTARADTIGGAPVVEIRYRRPLTGRGHQAAVSSW